MKLNKKNFKNENHSRWLRSRDCVVWGPLRTIDLASLSGS
jgi:hypothetical protein